MLNPQQQAALAVMVEAAKGEALFRPSNAMRWTNCAGSVALCTVSPELPTSNYAKEGTAAHIIAAAALKGERQPDEWSDRMVRFNDMEGVFPTEEMTSAASVYVDAILERVFDDTELHIEYPISLAALDSNNPLFAQNRGTVDALILDYKNRILTIGDFKYGAGIPVSANSMQLQNYALLALVNVKPPAGGWLRVDLVVVQPRTFSDPESVKVIQYDPNILMESLGRLIQAMVKALDPNAPLVADKFTGPGSWCHYCNGKISCPALAQSIQNLAIDMFEKVPMQPTINTPMPRPPDPATFTLPDVQNMQPDIVATWLESFGALEMWMTGVKQYAVKILAAGVPVPGWKLVARSGHRKWTKAQDETADELRTLGLKVSEIYTEPKLKSPAQVEKLLPKPQRGRINDLVERPMGEPTLVRAEDAKPAITGNLGPIPQELR